jgi:hypothetical protein
MKFVGRTGLTLSLIAVAGIAVAAERLPSRKLTAQELAFMTTDTNDDSRLSEVEYVGEKSGKARKKASREFRTLDANGDGWLSYKEHSQGETHSGFPR